MKLSALYIIIIAMSVAGCATAPSRPSKIDTAPPGSVHHTVKPGETLYGISKRYGAGVQELLSANNIRGGRTIEPGQVLLVPRRGPEADKTRPKAMRTDRNEHFVWPARGAVISSFGSQIDKVTNKGIDIRLEEGQKVVASRTGRVVFCDDHFKGFGKTVILDHGDNFQTVYAYNSDIIVKVGDAVNQKDALALVGRTGRAKEPSLHFEIRKNGEPQDPLRYLTN